MKTKRCKNCVYAVKVTGKGKSILICTNKPRSAGKLYLTEANKYCRNHQIKTKNKKPNRPKVTQPKNSDIRFIPLTKGKIAIVDAKDYPWLSKYKWYTVKIGNHFYAYRRKNSSYASMHREIMNAPKGLVVDHLDGNGLNNRRANLRLCTTAQNIFNNRPRPGSSKYKGVSFRKQHNKWVASICLKSKRIHLGYFNNEIDAAKAYDKKAAELFGQFAYLNFPT